jgi:hypothetical protein
MFLAPFCGSQVRFFPKVGQLLDAGLPVRTYTNGNKLIHIRPNRDLKTVPD